MRIHLQTMPAEEWALVLFTAGICLLTGMSIAHAVPRPTPDYVKPIEDRKSLKVKDASQLDKPRTLRKQPSRVGRRSELNEKIIAHTNSAIVRDLINFLTPRGWRVRYDVETDRLDREMVFHAETTRRRALDQLCLNLGFKGIFYPRKRLVLIIEGNRK